MEKMNLAIGVKNKNIANFVYLDAADGDEFVRSISAGLPFCSNRMQGIYMKDIPENLSRGEMAAFLRECRRVLKPGGVLRIVTANLDSLLEQYQSLAEKDNGNGLRSEWLNRRLRENGRRWSYNREELGELANVAGLKNAGEKKPGESGYSPFKEFAREENDCLVCEFEKRKRQVKATPLVSILITAYKPEFFREALESALKQTYSHLEIIICDDSPGREIEKIVSDYTPWDYRIKYVRNEKNLGGRRNYIKCFELAKGEFIKYLNDDDRLHKTCVERMVKYLRDFPEVTLVTSHRQLIDEQGKELPDQNFNKPIVETDSLIDGTSLVNEMLDRRTNIIGEPTTVMFRKADLAGTRPNIFSFGGRPALANGDVTIWVNLLSKGDAVYLTDSLSYFRLHPQQRQREAGFAEKGEKAWEQIVADARRLGFLGDQQPQRAIAWSLDQETDRPEDIPRLLKFTRQLAESENPERAEKLLAFLEQANETVKENTAFWDISGELALKRRNWLMAAECFARTRQLGLRKTDQTEKLLSQVIPHVQALAEAGKQPDAIALLEQLSEHLPDESPLLNELGVLYYQTGQDEKAVALLKRAIAVNPDDRLAKKNLASLYEWLGKIPAALELYLQVLQEEPSDLEILLALANLHIVYGDREKAVFYLKKAREVDPENMLVNDTLKELEKMAQKQVSEEKIEQVKNKPREKWQDSTPEISIIIPVFNRVEYTRKCLSAIHRNSGDTINFEVIVVDNGSSDDTPAFLTEAQNQFPWLRVVRNQENRGFAAACNQGAGEARGKYLLFLNNDTEPQPEWLENMLRSAKTDSRVGVVGARLLYPDGTVQHAGIGFLPAKKPIHLRDYGVVLALPDHPYRHLPGDDPRVNRPAEPDMVTGACMLIPANLFLDTGGFDEAYRNGGEDADLCLKIRSRGFKTVYNPQATVIHHEGKTEGRFSHIRENLERFFLRWGWAFDDDWKFNPAFLPLCEISRKSLTDGKAGSPPALPPDADLIFEKIRSEVQRLLRQQKIDDAIALYQNFLNDYPTHTLAHNELGVLHFQKDNPARVVHHLQIAVFLDPENLTIKKNLADFYLNLNINELAAEQYREILKSNPKDLEVLVALSEALVRQRQWTEAINVLNTAHSLAPEDERITRKIDEVIKAAGEPEDAAQELPEEEADKEKPEYETIPCPFCGSEEADPFRQNGDIVKCRKCKTVYLRTRLKSEDMTKMYENYADDDSHMRLPKNQEELEKNPLKRDYFLKEILEFTKPGGKILDVGCGWGAFLQNARQKGFEPIGIEITPDSVNFAREKLGLEVLSQPLEEVDFPPGSFVVVTMLHVLEHLPYPQKALRKVYEILKPEGLFCGIVPNIESFASEHQGDNWEWLDPNFHYLHFSPQVLKARLEEAGFVVERIYTTVGDFGEKNLKEEILNIYGPDARDIADEMITYMEANGYGEEIRFFARKPAEPPVKESQEEQKPEAKKTAESMAVPAGRQPDSQPSAKRKPANKSSRPDVSIIIPLYNQVAYTRKCLEAIYRNSCQEIAFEVILVDNASTDETPEFLKQAAKQYPNLRFIRNKENRKFAGACNQGAEMANGKYLVFLNNDTEPQPGWLKAALNRFRTDPDIGIVGAKLLYPDGTIQHCGIEFMEDVHPDYKVWPLHRHLRAPADLPAANRPEEVQAVTGACLFIPRKLFRKMDGFNEEYRMYFEDTDLCFKVRNRGRKVFYEPGSVVIHYEGKSSPDQKIIDELNTRAAKIFYRRWEKEILKIEFDFLVEKKDGKYHYLKNNLFPQIYEEGDVTRTGLEIARLFAAVEPFYAHFGGAGDALLLLSKFYEKEPVTTVVSVANSTAAMKSFFDAFPQIKKVYFIPYPENDISHALLRKIFPNLNNCLGMGVAPQSEFYEDEWNESLDVFNRYKIDKRPPWIKRFQTQKIEPRQVVIHPKGSVKGMVGSKRNIINQQYWIRLLRFLNGKGIRPIIIGTPDERRMYPPLFDCIDRRSYSFREQMELIASSDMFIGADSWGKTLAALAGIPTIVFHSVIGEDLQGWKDASDFVFLDPWDEIRVVEDFEEFEDAFREAEEMLQSEKRRFVWRSKRKKRPADKQAKESGKQFYLWREGGIGDVLMALPLVRALKENYPNSKVVFITRENNRSVVAANPYVDEVIPSVQMSRLSRQKTKIRDLNLAKFGIHARHQVDAYLDEFNLRVPDEAKEIVLNLPEEATRKVTDLLRRKIKPEDAGRKKVLIHAAKGDVNRTWPKEHWEALAGKLLREGYTVIATGSSSHDPTRGVFDLHIPGVVNLVDELSPLEFVALCRQADLLISTDSGPVQLAAASNIAIAAIYTVIPGKYRLPYRHGKLGWNAVAIESDCPYSGCYLRMHEKKYTDMIKAQIKSGKVTQREAFGNWCLSDEKYVCLTRLITPEKVWREIQPLVKALPVSGEISQSGEKPEVTVVTDSVTPEETTDSRMRDNSLYQQAIELYQKGEMAAAIKVLNRLVNENPEYSRAYFLLGKIAFELREYENARSFLTEAIARDPSHIAAQRLFGETLISAGEAESGIATFRKILENHPEDIPTRLKLAEVLSLQNRFDDALQVVRTGIKQAPGDQQLWKIYVGLLKETGDASGFREALSHYLTLNPRDPDALNELGVIYWQDNRMDLAIQLFERAVVYNGNHPEHLKNLADAYLTVEKFEDGIRMLMLLMQQFPDDFEAYEKMANLYVENGDYQSAKDVIDNYLKRNPGDRYARSIFDLLSLPDVYLAYKFINQGELNQARELLERFLEQRPDCVPALLGLASISFYRKAYSQAKELYRQVLMLDHRNEEALYYLGKILVTQQELAQFERLFRKYEEEMTSRQSLRKLTIEYLLAKGDSDGALEGLDRYLRDYPEDADVQLLAGNIHYQKGNFSRAKQCYELVLKLDPHNEIARENIRLLLEESGNGRMETIRK